MKAQRFLHGPGRASRLFVLALGSAAIAGCAARQDQVTVASEEPAIPFEANQNERPRASESNASTSSNVNAVTVEVDLARPLSDCPVDPAALAPLEPVPWSVADGPRRWGYGVTQVSAVRSSRMVPIEVCGVLGQTSWLTSLSCPDGTHPFGSLEEAHQARQGNVGPGGRCGAIVDHYQVPCQDQVYDVFMDFYHCTPTESF